MYIGKVCFRAFIVARGKRFFSKDLSNRLVSSSDGICRRIAQHRFYSEMVEGSLCRKRYQQFIDQDIIYLRSTIDILKMAKKQFSTHEDLFSNLINGYENEMEKFKKLQLSLTSNDEIKNMSSACSEYVAVLSNAIQSRNLSEFIALLLACYLIFQRIAIEHFASVHNINSVHPYFDFLKDLNSYKIISSENKLLRVLDAEINSKPEDDQEFSMNQAIKFYTVGLKCEMKLLDSLYE